MPQLRNNDASIGELFGQLTHDVGTLFRQEVRLAKVEMGEKVSTLGAGAAVAGVGALALGAALILGLVALGVAPWLAALLVGGALAVAGYSMLQKGMSDLKRNDLVPTRTVETLKDDVQWVKEQRT
jgi:predicted phage tail protein